MDKAFKIAVVLSAYDKMSTVVNAAFASASNTMNKAQRFAHHLSEVSERAAIAGEGIMHYTDQAIEAAEQSEKFERVAQQVWKNAGDRTGEAAEQMAKFAKSYGPVIGKTHEEVQAVQNKLAIFKSLSSETGRVSGMFDRATKAAFNFAANGMGEASGNAVKFGKALENPTKYVKSLARAGVILSDSELAKIKVYQSSGRLQKAQEILMTALEKKSKGLAEANALGSDKMKAKWHELYVTLGQKLLPIFDKVVDKVTHLIDVISEFSDRNPGIVKAIAITGATLLAFGTVGKVVAFSITSIVNVVGFAQKAFTFLSGAFTAISRVMMANPILLIIAAIAISAYLIYNNWAAIKNFFINLWASVTAIFSKVWAWIKKMFLNYTPQGLIIKHWDKIKQWFIGLWGKVKEIFMSHVRWVMGLGATFYNAGKNIIMSIWNGIKNFVSKPIEAIKNMAEKIRKFLPFSPAKEGALKDIHKIRLVETIAESIKVQPVVQAMNRVGNAVFNAGGGGGPVAAIRGGASSIHFAPVINLSGSATQADARMLNTEMKKQFEYLMKDYMQHKERVSF